MNLFGMNPIVALRERMGAALGVFAVSMLCCVMGVLMTFVFAPGQALQANRISRLPQMDAESVNNMFVGDTVLVTGMLHGDPAQTGVDDLIAYKSERWDVTVPEDTEDGPADPYGTWKSIPSVVPELTVEINGQSVTTQSADNILLGGNLHELIVPGEGELTAKSDGQPFNDGTIRYRGFFDGDLVTVYGKKTASGGIDPSNLYAGDRAAFENAQQQATKGLLYSGICMFILTPIVLVGGLIWVVFKRR
jgi:hypothetical protein